MVTTLLVFGYFVYAFFFIAEFIEMARLKRFDKKGIKYIPLYFVSLVLYIFAVVCQRCHFADALWLRLGELFLGWVCSYLLLVYVVYRGFFVFLTVVNENPPSLARQTLENFILRPIVVHIAIAGTILMLSISDLYELWVLSQARM